MDLGTSNTVEEAADIEHSKNMVCAMYPQGGEVSTAPKVIEVIRAPPATQQIFVNRRSHLATGSGWNEDLSAIV